VLTVIDVLSEYTLCITFIHQEMGARRNYTGRPKSKPRPSYQKLC